MGEPIVLQVNGKSRSVRVDPRTPLLYVLRNDLELNGPKYGCGEELCGSCMVLIDAQAVPTCKLTVAEAVGKRIVTLEGLGTPEKLHPLQQAFIDEQAAQCGYCINGMIVRAAGLLNRNPSPSDTEARDEMTRVICRCGTHERILRSIERVIAKGE